MPDTPLFVVVLTANAEAAFSTAPRAIGPFEDFDVAQAFCQALVERYRLEGEDVPDASVVRVEPDQPGVVMGEI